MGSVVRLPERPTEATTRGTRRHALASLARAYVGRILHAIGLPGAIRDHEFVDSATGQRIEIRVGDRFTRISINGRDYYFTRFRGRLDGTGSGCDCR